MHARADSALFRGAAASGQCQQTHTHVKTRARPHTHKHTRTHTRTHTHTHTHRSGRTRKSTRHQYLLSRRSPPRRQEAAEIPQVTPGLVLGEAGAALLPVAPHTQTMPHYTRLGVRPMLYTPTVYIYLSIYLSIYIYLYLSIFYLFIHLSLSIYLSIYLTKNPYIYLSISIFQD